MAKSWDEHKDIILEYYARHNLLDTVRYMKERYNFHAVPRSYHKKFVEWKICKHENRTKQGYRDITAYSRLSTELTQGRPSEALSNLTSDECSTSHTTSRCSSPPTKSEAPQMEGTGRHSLTCPDIEWSAEEIIRQLNNSQKLLEECLAKMAAYIAERRAFASTSTPF
ncbi:uncharacterized protein G6M90_00g068430 [Metarhizium brunneum]|uniref:Clr5 domain-containing protein n=3 Tax=Metarhizium TaxID=5529 RepID=E9F1S6_METRA|nr:uncharacterized protein MAA_06124 [Metarhizium robertsii ARSEF 23]EFY98015.1 hypothetical protein MAA_06124 [Metarhizium robertsii ARSEF 23]EXU95249.1 Clr5 domain protein [Metarhizium robertsii]QLI70751.1 hypothetical protein G6M90_00g068430 [Metarhizium brunneum]